ncbi:MAG: restriction endonuclease [Christensenellales bacterium]
MQKLRGRSGQHRRAGSLRGRNTRRCDIPVVVCPTDFTIPARELAESTGVELWDGERLSHMMP